MKPVKRKILTALALILVIALSTAQVLPAWAQTPDRSFRDSSQKQKTKSLKKPKRVIILGTTILGSVVGPRVVYEVPWQEPDSFKRRLEEPRRSFHDEIFGPLQERPLELNDEP